jgi:hypothetical protein
MIGTPRPWHAACQRRLGRGVTIAPWPPAATAGDGRALVAEPCSAASGHKRRRRSRRIFLVGFARKREAVIWSCQNLQQ